MAESMKITALTTACARPEAWKLCEKFMSRQTRQPHQWLVLDDDDPPTQCTMQQQYIYNPEWRGSLSLLKKIEFAIQNNLITGDAVAFVENDDFYAPTWLEFCAKQLESCDMIGEGLSIYYNVKYRYWMQYRNMRHSSLCSTAVRAEQLQKVLELCDTTTNKDPFLDQRMWLDNGGMKCSKKIFNPDGKRLVIGIKGMPGRAGYNIGHGFSERGGLGDRNLVKLHSLIGDDAELYKPFYDSKAADMSKLSALGMWEEWQKKASASISKFATEAVYATQNSYSEERFKEVAKEVAAFGPVDVVFGRTRDAEFGARVVETELGGVTRMWLDGNVEIDFIRRNIPNMERLRVLDIGAGYGRLAVMMRPLVKEYTCVDPVKVSTEICRTYTARFDPRVITLGIEEFVNSNAKYDLAINIHCWNECTLEQVDAWIEAIADRKIQHLFTVDHGRPGAAYNAWNNTGSFRPVIESHYRMVKEETLAIEQNAHALWILK
jgi:hypothetical protein